ncbi:MAG TPA: Zn-ribbon domain-containing OB-fold protein [Rhizomicrobium sp.]|nr:Zn-ribbon domain-containing OB-fold protein [Rhizomicrobium sp.]
MPSRMLPEPTPETRHFWDGCAAGELLLQRCTECGDSYFPPRPFCPKCSSRAVEVYKASGKGVLWSYVINMRPRPDMGTEPYAIAVVKLAEGPQMMTNITGCPQTPEALVLDMPVQVTFAKMSDTISLPLFEPAPQSQSVKA